jgi:hypothetical protein
MSSNGGLNISDVSGSVTFGSGHVAGGDVVMGNKSVTITTTVEHGFAREDDKEDFKQKLDQFAKTLLQMQKLLELEDGLSDADKKAIGEEVARHVAATVAAKQAVAATPAGTLSSD